MADERLLTISTFARAVGVPASALRYYAAQNVLAPADVDPTTGYRYYAPAQIASGVLVRRMRAAGVSLPVMRAVLTASAQEASRLLDQEIAAHCADARGREQELTALREHLCAAQGRQTPSRVHVSGPVLSAAVDQVLPATARAADDVSGLVWDIGPAGLQLIATDRYRLVQRTLHVPTDGEPGRAITTPEDAEELARACARHGMVQIRLDDQVSVLGTDGAVLATAPSVERSVPDLGLLVATQPAAQLIAGFSSTDLAAQLDDSAGRPHVRLVAREGALVLTGDAAVSGWAWTAPGCPDALELRMQPGLLASAVSACPGPEVLISLVDGTTPIRVQSRDQETMTCLVMPMRP